MRKKEPSSGGSAVSRHPMWHGGVRHRRFRQQTLTEIKVPGTWSPILDSEGRCENPGQEFDDSGLGDTDMANEIRQESKTQQIRKAEPAGTLSPFEEMNRMFDQFFGGGWVNPWRFRWPSFPDLALPEMSLPKVDVIDRENEVLVKAEVPGVEKKDLDISVGENTVMIKGSTQHEEKEEKGDFVRHEISSGAFSRTVVLPSNVDGTRAKAVFKDGILELTIPKVETAKRHTVKVG